MVEDFAHVLGIGLIIAPQLYNLLDSFVEVGSILQKIFEFYVNKKDLKKLQMLLEMIEAFIVIEERNKGRIVKILKESREIQEHLKGIIKGIGSQIGQKTMQTISSIIIQ